MNVDVMVEVRHRISEEPERHDQGSWYRTTNAAARLTAREAYECCTAACAAGHAVMVAGIPIRFLSRHDRYGVPEGGKGWAEAGMEALGISPDLASVLFLGTWSTRQVLAGLDMLIEAGKNGWPVTADDLRDRMRSTR